MDTTDPDAALVVAKVRASHWFDPEPPSTLTTVSLISKQTVLNRIAESPLLAPLLLSNDSPTASQYTAAQEFLELHNARRSKIRIERSEVEFAIRALSGVAALKATRLVLIEAEHVMRAQICLLRAIMSPIRRVPPEIIQEIFLLLTPSLDLRYPPHDPSPILKVRTPWYLGHICRSWRDIALSLGLLWSVFDIDVSDIHPNEPCDSIHLRRAITCRLQRSAHAPISIRVRHRTSDGLNHTTELLNMFAKHVHRFKRLDLESLPVDALNVLWQPSTKFDPLRSLGPTDNSVASRTSFLCLSNLTLNHITLPMHPQFCFPWIQLLKYEEAHCRWPGGGSDRWSSYSQLSNMIDLSIEFGPQFSANPPADPLLLPRLRKARIVLFGKQHFLHLFEMPSLHTLIYEHCGHSFSEDDNQAPTIHLPCSIRRLRVLRIFVDGDRSPHPSINFSNMLSASPCLSVLSISIPHLNVDTFVTSLIPSEHRPPLGQKLATVCLQGSRFNNREDVDKMLQFRFEPQTENVTCMRSFALFRPEPRPFREQMIQSCVGFRRMGWAVKVKDGVHDCTCDDESDDSEVELTVAYIEYLNGMFSLV
ncbi:hypothetical protein C8F04DRAFT_1197061 [Mycena alexandri]|uniref:F-box domain-containing protein n=1 Tax=Mycena alexandri TaxID=1745969 RepID=A0AAD6S2M4_9AGAR|nr:hypothetical protein C8F04DRAFT_1197061 [Mycena alexandri]